jgi:plastocyanin
MENQWPIRKNSDQRKRKIVAAITLTTITKVTILIIAAAIIASPLLLLNGMIAQAQPSQSLAGTTFPPPVFSTIRSQPTYEINIPFSSESKPVFEPKEISIPTGMTVIWFNNDDGQHSITTLANSSYPPPKAIDSGVIPPDGGSFIYQFNQPGSYVYLDQFNPSVHGIVTVGSAIEQGKTFNMYIGGISSLPFNPSQAHRMVLSFVPKTVKFPPVISLTYNVTILNSTGKPLYSHTYDDSDGILDMELVPIHKNVKSTTTTSTSTTNTSITTNAAQKQFATWGSDFIGEEQFDTDGVFHISGPVLVQNSPYSIVVSIVANSNRELQNPITDTFVLPSTITK